MHHHATDPLLAGRAESEVPCRAVRLSSFRGRPLARILEPPGRQRLSAAAVTVAANSDAAAIFDLLAQSSSVGRSVGRRGRYHRRDCSGWTATDARPPTHSMLLSLRRIAAVERCADSIVTHTHTHTASLLHHARRCHITHDHPTICHLVVAGVQRTKLYSFFVMRRTRVQKTGLTAINLLAAG